MDKLNIISELQKIIEEYGSSSSSKFLTAKQVEGKFGINYKTLLNRSNLPTDHKRHIPSVRLKGGRRKYFERKVIDRILQVEGGVK